MVIEKAYDSRIKDRSGFTLAELLLVVAIIGVLVAVSIPIFTGQLEKSRESTDFATMQAAKAAAVSAYYRSADTDDWKDKDRFFYDITTGKIVESTGSGVPAAYGKGTAKEGYAVDSGKYYDPCGDKNYDPDTDYTDKIIVAYVEDTTMHVHWISGENAGSYTPSVKPDDDDDDDDDIPEKTDTDPDDDDDKPSDPGDSGDGDFPSSVEEWEKVGGSYTVVLGGVYKYKGQYYVSLANATYRGNEHYMPDLNGDHSLNFIKVDSDTPVYTIANATLDYDHDGVREVIPYVEYGGVYKGSEGYYIYKGRGSNQSHPESAHYDTNSWVKITSDIISSILGE